MPLSPGDKLGPYEVLTPIGAGGSGGNEGRIEVFEDTVCTKRSTQPRR
jgi:hypothetical protein